MLLVCVKVVWGVLARDAASMCGSDGRVRGSQRLGPGSGHILTHSVTAFYCIAAGNVLVKRIATAGEVLVVCGAAAGVSCQHWVVSRAWCPV